MAALRWRKTPEVSFLSRKEVIFYRGECRQDPSNRSKASLCIEGKEFEEAIKPNLEPLEKNRRVWGAHFVLFFSLKVSLILHRSRPKS